ncbi:MAG: Clp protease N-terminal domain-containing protein [Nocardioides sp.]
MLERFTRNARDIVVRAHESARAAGAAEVLPAHLFATVVGTDGTLAVHVLEDLGAPREEVRRVVAGLTGHRPAGLSEDDAEALRVLGIDLDDVVRRIEDELGSPADATRARPSRPRFAKASKKVLELSLREAVRLGDGFIGTEHVLLGLIRSGDRVVLGTLEAFDLTPDDVRRAVDEAERRTG